MKVILYSTQHGATKKIGQIMSEYLGDCLLMDIHEVDVSILNCAEMIIVGAPVYYRKLNSDIVSFIKKNQELLISKQYSLFVVGIFASEFMTFVTQSFDYHILKHMKIISGVGGIIYFPNLSITEKMILQVMNKKTPMIKKAKNKDLFQNINDKEIKIFTDKIKKLTQ